MTNKNNKNDQTKTDIVIKARDLFKRFGLNKTTMEDIAQTMSKGKSTLYYYFSGKEEVFYAVAQKEIADTFGSIIKEVEKEKNAQERLRAFFLKRFDVLEEKLNTYPAMVREQKKDIEIIHKIHAEFSLLERNLIKDILLCGVKSGEFKHITKKDCDSLATAASTILSGVDIYTFVEGRVPPIGDQLNIFFSITMRGVK
ncbi:MAG: TetR/AcrR family transcriptional regulator [Elusimicrobiota bacterium]|nr:TetR/AcrR family transcriptional regulator [Elusimicrobiota bacterium]